MSTQTIEAPSTQMVIDHITVKRPRRWWLAGVMVVKR